MVESIESISIVKNIKLTNTTEIIDIAKSINSDLIMGLNNNLTGKKLNIVSSELNSNIKFNKNNNLSIDKYKITQNLEIKFANSFNSELTDDYINKFKLYDKIIFGFSFNQLITHKIPGNVKLIMFGHNFNTNPDNIIIHGDNLN